MYYVILSYKPVNVVINRLLMISICDPDSSPSLNSLFFEGNVIIVFFHLKVPISKNLGLYFFI